MRRLSKWKIRLLVWVFNQLGLGYFFIVHGVDGEEDNGCTVWDSEDVEHISAILHSTIENVPAVREIITGAMLRYLKRYEVDCKHFLEELKKD